MGISQYQYEHTNILILIHININMYQIFHCSRCCCFAAPIAMPINDSTLIYVNHAQ